jgi:hypothetical protein
VHAIITCFSVCQVDWYCRNGGCRLPCLSFRGPVVNRLSCLLMGMMRFPTDRPHCCFGPRLSSLRWNWPRLRPHRLQPRRRRHFHHHRHFHLHPHPLGQGPQRTRRAPTPRQPPRRADISSLLVSLKFAQDHLVSLTNKTCVQWFRRSSRREGVPVPTLLYAMAGRWRARKQSGLALPGLLGLQSRPCSAADGRATSGSGSWG